MMWAIEDTRATHLRPTIEGFAPQAPLVTVIPSLRGIPREAVLWVPESYTGCAVSSRAGMFRWRST